MQRYATYKHNELTDFLGIIALRYPPQYGATF